MVEGFRVIWMKNGQWCGGKGGRREMLARMTFENTLRSSHGVKVAPCESVLDFKVSLFS